MEHNVTIVCPLFCSYCVLSGLANLCLSHQQQHCVDLCIWIWNRHCQLDFTGSSQCGSSHLVFAGDVCFRQTAKVNSSGYLKPSQSCIGCGQPGCWVYSTIIKFFFYKVVVFRFAHLSASLSAKRWDRAKSRGLAIMTDFSFSAFLGWWISRDSLVISFGRYCKNVLHPCSKNLCVCNITPTFSGQSYFARAAHRSWRSHTILAFTVLW